MCLYARVKFNFLFRHVVVNNFSLKKVLIGHYRGAWCSINKPFGAFFLAKTCIFSFEYMYYCYRRALFFIFKLFLGGYNRFVFFVNGLPFVSYTFLASKFVSGGFINKFTKSRSVVRWVPGLLTNMKLILLRFKLKYLSSRNKKKNLLRKANMVNLRRIVRDYRVRLGKRKRRVGHFRFPNLVIFLSSSLYYLGAIREAFLVGIPTVGIVDSDSLFGLLSFPISGNDDSLLSVVVYLQIFSESIFRGISKNMFREELFLNIPNVCGLVEIAHEKLRVFSMLNKIQKKRFVFSFFKHLRMCLYFNYKNKVEYGVFRFYRFEIFSKFLKYYFRVRKIFLFLSRFGGVLLNYFRMLLNSEVVYVFLKKFCFSVRCAIKHNLTFFLNRFVRLFSGFSCGRLSLRRFFLMKRKCFVSFKVFHGKFRYCKRLFKRRRRYRCLKKSLRGAAGV